MTELRGLGQMIHVMSGGFSNCPFLSLKDKIVKEIFVSPGEDEIRIVTDEGTMGAQAVGDCCSESWFADFTGVDALLNHRVLEVEIVDMDDPCDDRCRQEVDQVYGYKFKTEAGYADLVFRNSSNGYYGGWVEPSTALNATVPITDDWSA